MGRVEPSKICRRLNEGAFLAAWGAKPQIGYPIIWSSAKTDDDFDASVPNPCCMSAALTASQTRVLLGTGIPVQRIWPSQPPYLTQLSSRPEPGANPTGSGQVASRTGLTVSDWRQPHQPTPETAIGREQADVSPCILKPHYDGPYCRMSASDFWRSRASKLVSKYDK